MGPETGIAVLAERLRTNPRTTVLTGAGVSAASGVPTYRGSGGFWRGRRAEDMATLEAFDRDPEAVWEWYDSRRTQLAGCTPNRAHEVLAAWSRRMPGFTLVTQNVDGLHERAGTISVVRFHGSIWELRCREDCPQSPPRWEDLRAPLPELPPRCPHCEGLLRPGVVWFGEMIDPAVLEAAAAATDCEVFLTVGTSSLVHPAAALVAEAGRRGAFTVEVNLEATPASSMVDLVLEGPAERILGAIEDALCGT